MSNIKEQVEKNAKNGSLSIAFINDNNELVVAALTTPNFTKIKYNIEFESQRKFLQRIADEMESENQIADKLTVTDNIVKKSLSL